MLNNFNKINIQMERLSKQSASSLPIIIEAFEKSKFKYTSKALLMFMVKSGFISSSINYLVQTNNLYSSSILFRSLIEHYFRHLYIYTRALRDDNDSVGIDYYKNLKNSETIESFSKINNFNKIINPNETTWKVGGEENKQISKIAKQFGIKEILIYLINNFHSSELNKLLPEKKLKQDFKKILDEYAKLSSSIHGGPTAEKIIDNYHKNKKSKQKDEEYFVVQSFKMQKAITETTFLFACLLDNKCCDIYKLIKK
ncbi:MAG: hypothetical protein PHU94_03875 [Bacilli bacterium]|nr:hypothetical protein [Bacilli bacterium]